MKVRWNRPSQQQQFRYICLDRKFASGNLFQIYDALDELEVQLANFTHSDLINSIVSRLIELIPNNKAPQLKVRILRLLEHHPRTLSLTLAPQQICTSLHRLIKHPDPSTRIVAMRILCSQRNIPNKDVSLYHSLLGKLSQKGVFSLQQSKQAVVCLSLMLSSSPHLSKLFSKGITDLYQIYNIPLHIILYLLTFAQVDNHYQQEIINSILTLKNKAEIFSKKEKYYFGKLVYLYATKNYRIVTFYQQTGLNRTLNNIQPKIEALKRNKYPFLQISSSIHSQIIDENIAQSIEQLIQLLYCQKKEKISLSPQLQKKITQLLNVNILKFSEQTQKCLLILYFTEQNQEKYDSILLKHLQSKQLPSNLRTFEQLAVIGCYKSALSVLQSLQLPQSIYIFLKSYLNFKTNFLSFPQLLQISQLLHVQLYKIVKSWELIGQLIQSHLTNQRLQDIRSFQSELKAIHQTINREQFGDISEMIGLFIEDILPNSIINIKKMCYHLLPSSIINGNNEIWFTHLDKNTIRSIIKMNISWP